MLTGTSACSENHDGSFTSTIISAGPDIPKATPKRTTSNEEGRNDPSALTPLVKNFLNLENATVNPFPEVGSSPMIGGSGKKLKDLPHTTTLKGCVAFVDVWSTDATDNRSSVFRKFLARMGATVAPKFTKEQPITHVIFKNGHKSVLQKAQKRKLKIVNCLWVESCRHLQKWVEEDEFLFDPTNYKPPKKFREMQPLEPEEVLRRSAESLKRRKARFAKKNARIMFQSPLVTKCYSANATPTDGNTPVNGKCGTQNKPSVLAADTPFYMPSLARYFSPSIVYETPLTDSMQRKLQRLKEGKRVFSPPPSDDEDSEDEKKDTEADCTSSDETPTERPEFSPVPETQCVMKKSWRQSGIAPPKFDVSYDEIPDTQDVEVPDTPEDVEEKEPVAIIRGVTEVPETQHPDIPNLHESQLPDPPLFSSTAKDSATANEKLSFTSNKNSSSILPNNDSNVTLDLHVSPENSEMESLSQITLNDGNNKRKKSLEQPNSPEHEMSPCESDANLLLAATSTVPSRKRRRRLLAEEELCEPISLLVSPQVNNEKSKDKMPMILPELGYSAFKGLKKSGKYFAEIRSFTQSESSDITLGPSSQTSSVSSRSSHHENSGDEFDFTKIDDDAAIMGNSLGLYDRIKMRKKRNSIVSDYSILETPAYAITNSILSSPSHSVTKKWKSSQSRSVCKKPKGRRKDQTRKSTQFFSQAANTIIHRNKKRRSSFDFVSPTKETVRQNPKKFLTLTNFHSNERSQTLRSMKYLPDFQTTALVNDATTHVVCGASRRTTNVLRAIARGLWLLSENWVKDSVSAGFWLEEESYEIGNMFPAVKKNRYSRLDDPTWKNDLFSNFEGLIYVSDHSKPLPVIIFNFLSLIWRFQFCNFP